MRLVLSFLFAGFVLARAQDASLADVDMNFTREILAHYHFHVRAQLKTPKGEIVRFEYDRYPQAGAYHGAERIKADEGVFVRRAGSTWIKSDDWGKSGTPAPQNLIAELDTYVAVTDVPFETPQNLDTAQGRNVWKFIEKSGSDGITYYTYERSREHPKPGGLYPRFSFMKAAHDVDGKLFCVQATGALRSATDRVPFVIDYIYLVPLPPGTQVKVFDQVTKKEKYQTITDNDSGWEITAQQSAPPTDTTPMQLNSAPVEVDTHWPGPDALISTPPAPASH